MTPPALELQGITKRFGEVVALDGASFTVRAGTVHALVGENGAGKTTLMRVAFGLVRPEAGTVQVEGQRADFHSPGDAIAAGVGMVHQHFALVPTMTVAENIALGARGRYSARSAAERVRQISATSGLPLDPDALAGDLSVSAQQRVEIAKALSREARILILDEPTAVLAPAEAAELLQRLRSFADAGRAVILITHKLREALSIADEVTVLRHGANVLSVPSSGATESGLVAAIVGMPAPSGGGEGPLHVLAGATPDDQTGPRELAGDGNPGSQWQNHRTDTKVVVDDSLAAKQAGERPPQATPRVVLEARGIGLNDHRGVVKVRDASFAIHEGEIVGIAAVEGAGHHELLRALAGRLEPATGTLTRPGNIGFIPEDRHRDALILDFSLTENVALRGAGARRGSADWDGTEARTRRLLDEFDVRAQSAQATASTLSGGNQQKLVLARELDESPAVLIAENPTHGLDIQSSAMIHERLRRAAAAGTAVVVHSSDLDELMALASRILVVYAGTVHEVPHDRDAAGRGMLGLFAPTPR